MLSFPPAALAIRRRRRLGIGLRRALLGALALVRLVLVMALMLIALSVLGVVGRVGRRRGRGRSLCLNTGGRG